MTEQKEEDVSEEVRRWLESRRRQLLEEYNKLVAENKRLMRIIEQAKASSRPADDGEYRRRRPRPQRGYPTEPMTFSSEADAT